MTFLSQNGRRLAELFDWHLVELFDRLVAVLPALHSFLSLSALCLVSFCGCVLTYRAIWLQSA